MAERIPGLRFHAVFFPALYAVLDGLKSSEIEMRLNFI